MPVACRVEVGMIATRDISIRMSSNLYSFRDRATYGKRNQPNFSTVLGVISRRINFQCILPQTEEGVSK